MKILALEHELPNATAEQFQRYANANYKLIALHIQRIKSNLQNITLQFIQLGINEYIAASLSIPIFHHP